MRKRLWGLLIAAALLVGQWSATAAFSIPDGYSQDGRLIMASEPGVADSDYVAFYQHDEKQSLDSIPWEDGREGHGKAVALSGQGDYFAIGYDQLRLTNFTISLWVNWKGAVSGGSADQRLLSIVQDEDNYISLSTLHQDADHPDAEGRIANGLFLDVAVNGEHETGFKPSAPNVQTTLPQGEWHHVAIVARQPAITLYVDGVEMAHAGWYIGLRELNPNYLRIGGGEEGSASLYALVDDVEVYGFDATSDQLLMLAGGVDPLAEGATVPSSTTSVSVTRKTTTTTVMDLTDTNKDVSLRVALTVGGCGLGIFLLLTLGSLIFGKKPPADSSEGKGGTSL